MRRWCCAEKSRTLAAVRQPLAGTVALVTGASSGIGAATAQRLAVEGAAVALVARRRDRLAHVADAIRRTGATAHVIHADITAPEHAAHAVRETVDRFDRLDTLVNNAGLMLLGPALHTTTDDWDRMLTLNIQALLHITHAALPHLVNAAATSPRHVADIVSARIQGGRRRRARCRPPSSPTGGRPTWRTAPDRA